jgi:hypothetical protein
MKDNNSVLKYKKGDLVSFSVPFYRGKNSKSIFSSENRRIGIITNFRINESKEIDDVIYDIYVFSTKKIISLPGFFVDPCERYEKEKNKTSEKF